MAELAAGSLDYMVCHKPENGGGFGDPPALGKSIVIIVFDISWQL